MLKNIMLKHYQDDNNPNYNQFSKLVASDGAANDYFGYSVAISSDGGYAVVGAYADDDKGNNSGSVYIYTKQENEQYTQNQKLTASDGAAGDYFGFAVSISGDGRYIVVGSTGDDDRGTNSGSVYVFNRQENGQYTQIQKVRASDGAASDSFGFSVSISGDGGYIVIGSCYDDDRDTNSGSVYVFNRQENGQYAQLQKLTASDGVMSDLFGSAVAISDDGGIIVIGSNQDDDNGGNSGSVYIFIRQENGQYTQTQKLLASDGAAGDYFGFAVSISGDGEFIVVGAPNARTNTDIVYAGSVYIFTKQVSGIYVQTQKLTASDGAMTDYFGYSVAISDDGGYMAVGAYGVDDKGTDSGAAYIFGITENEQQYTQLQKITASNGAASDNFGFSIDLSGDGGSVVIGAPYTNSMGAKSGSAYFFK